VATIDMSRVIEHFRKTVLAGGQANLSDGQLLECFVRHRDEAAVAALVRRHGPMVWGVCRRILRSHHDAEDAFQATFLVLVRKAASVVPREMVANWLYGVAHQTALKARATTAKRHEREKQVKEIPDPGAGPEPDPWRDLQPLLDHELSGLPDKYRVAVALCDLQGKSRKEAARQLEIPEGTLSSRLTSARRLLAKRLTRHGLGISGGSLAAIVSQNAASASVPNLLLSSTIKAAISLAAGQAAAGVVSTKVAALTEGVLKAMLLAKLKTALAVVFLLAVVGSGLGLINYQLEAADRVEPKKVTKEPVAPGSDALAGLRKARVIAARRAFDKVWEQYRTGWHDEEQVYRWSVRLLEAERAATVKEADGTAALRGHLRRMKELQQWALDRPIIGPPATAAPVRLGEGKGQARLVHITDGKKGGNTVMVVEDIPRTDIAALTAFYRAEAEVWLAEAKAP
jgi:RNA polymerase sigma factor (sigma-70 family)